MRCLASSYEHIGPFSDSIYTIRFLTGASLIKAPIGSGKSFLFFDGLVFGLYKRSSRPMLNRHAKQGQIQVLWTHAGQQWIVIRRLTSTKAGNDSVVSELFHVHLSLEHIDALLDAHYGHQVMSQGVLLDTLFPKDVLERVTATNQKEVDHMIVDLLPPKELTLSSCILMQDSDNIFDMTPTTRIHVFKQLFNLLDMDHIKDRLVEIKKQTQLRRQILQDDQTINDQFIKSLRELIVYRDTIQTCVDKTGYAHAADRLHQTFFRDLSVIDIDQIHLSGYVLQGYDPVRTDHVLRALEEHIQALLMRQGQYEHIHEQRLAKREQLAGYEKTSASLLAQIQEKEHILSSYQVHAFQDMQEQKESIDQAIESLHTELPYDIAKQYGLVFSDIGQARELMYQQLAEAKQYTQQLTTLQQQEDYLRNQQKDLLDQQEKITTQLSRLTDPSYTKTVFHCDKIAASCPYVEAIRKMNASSLDDQRTYLSNQLVDIAKSRLPDVQQRLAGVSTEKDCLSDMIQQRRTMFSDLERPRLEGVFARYEELQLKKRTLTERIQSFREQMNQVKNIQDTLTSLHDQHKQSLYDRDRLREEIDILTEKIDALATHADLSYIDTYTILSQHLQKVIHVIASIEDMVTQHTIRQQEIRDLQTKELLTKDLSHIFQKELLIIVLQDFLPVLEDLINMYLEKVVDFSLRFELPKTMQEQIEIVLWIDDEQGQRSVKSLSGGQKAVLRLCRILAVSSLFKQEYLLLDETINSLDQEAIGRVASLLEDFVKQHDICFYLVTHAPQIQDMSFWQRTVQVNTISGS